MRVKTAYLPSEAVGFTINKEYEVTQAGKTCGYTVTEAPYITDDNGIRRLLCLKAAGCAHLNFHRWTILED